MKVAIVGGNFLGCATAHYLRRTLDDARTPAADDDAAPNDEIVIFDKSPALGGHKFVTEKLGGVDVLTGTAADIETSASPLFSGLLADAGIEPALLSKPPDWAVFDWDKDQYRLSCVPLPFVSVLMSSPLFRLLIHVFCVASTAFFVQMHRRGELFDMFRYSDDVWATLLMVWMLFIAFCGFGIVPVRLLVGMYNRMFMSSFVGLSARFAYGSAPDMAHEIAKQMSEHLQVVHENNSCSSGITVGHLLSRCGLAKYARVAASEQLESFHINESFRDDIIAPALAAAYSESRFRPSHVSNSLATMLEMMTRAPFPAVVRPRARRLSVNQTKTLCPKLASAARARLQVCTDVVGILRDESAPHKYSLRVRTKQGENIMNGFDAIVLAATVDASTFNTDDVIPELHTELAQTDDVNTRAPLDAEALSSSVRRRNTARCMAIVVGNLKASYFRRRSPAAVATHSFVLNSIDCAEVTRVGPRVYRVLCADKLDKDSELVQNLFESVERINSWERAPARYFATPMRSINGRDVPAIVLTTRIINAAATDRVGNHVEIDCLSARNTASLFKEGTITWK